MRHLAITGMETAAMISRMRLGLAMRATPPSARIIAGTRSSAMTAVAPACSAMRACSTLMTSMMTPPLSISARPTFRRRLVVPEKAVPPAPFVPMPVVAFPLVPFWRASVIAGVPPEPAGPRRIQRVWSGARTSSLSAFDDWSPLAQPAPRLELVEFQDEQGHIVVLRSAAGKRIGFRENGAHHRLCRYVPCGGGGGHHPLLAPLFVVVGHGFADAVGVADQQVARLHSQALLGVSRLRQQTHDRPIGLEPQDFRRSACAPSKHQRRVMAGVHALQHAGVEIERAEEKSRIPVCG